LRNYCVSLDSAQVIGSLEHGGLHVLYLGDLGAAQLKKEPTDFNAFLNVQLSEHHIAAQKKGINLTLEFPPHVAITSLNPNKFIQVVVNLLTNALKFSLVGMRVVVRLSVHTSRPRLSV
jgi:signal transduction histidine kinase